MSRRAIDATECVRDLQHIRGADKNAYWQSACDYLINKIDAMPTVEVPTWIPVTERLPEEWTYVLVLTKVGSQIIAVRSGRFWREHYTHQKLEGDVTHWMPLPDAPKDGDE